MTRLVIIALVALGLWTLGVLLGFALAHASDDPEWDDRDDDVQPADPYTFGLSESATGGPSHLTTNSTVPPDTDIGYTSTSGHAVRVDWRN